MNSSLFAVVIACQGRLVVRSLREDDQEPQVNPETGEPTDTEYTFTDTGSTLGVSPEALELLKALDRNNDDVGELNWMRNANGEPAFSWIGGPISAFDPATFVAPRTFEILDYVEIVNDEYLTPEITLGVDVEQKLPSFDDPNLSDDQKDELAAEIVEEIIEAGIAGGTTASNDDNVGDNFGDDLAEILSGEDNDEEIDEILAEEMADGDDDGVDMPNPGAQHNL